MAETSAARAFPWYDPRQSGGRVILSVCLGVSVMLALASFGWPVRVVAAWDTAGLTLLGMAWWIIARSDPAETRRRAGAEDPGRTLVWVVALLSSTVSLGAATILLPQARRLAPEASSALAVLCLLAVAVAWILTHSAYTLRYAHLFYRDEARDGGRASGLEFPGGRPPDDLDFAYFSFTIGMCYQTSDVTVSSHLVRRTVLVHSVISFAYNTAIVALALNLVFGLFN